MIKLNKLEESLNYHFKDIRLLKKALTHSSYVNEHELSKTDCYERLEFLGDAILEMYSSEYLYRLFPDDREGALSKKRATLVCEEGLGVAARELNLSDYLILGVGADREGTREMDSVLSDTFEALIAALFLDGGPEVARRLIYDHVLNNIDEKLIYNDAKSVLQEVMQKEGRKVTYSLIGESGPDHDKTFIITCLIDNNEMETGNGKSKKAAEQDAAKKTLLKIKGQDACI